MMELNLPIKKKKKEKKSLTELVIKTEYDSTVLIPKKAPKLMHEIGWTSSQRKVWCKDFRKGAPVEGKLVKQPARKVK